MEIPRDLAVWTYETIVDIARDHEFEPGEFDYKPALVARGADPVKEELTPSIRRTACGMANADGGFILFGVKDRKYQVSSPEKRIEGIPLGADLRKQFGDKISDIQRELYFEAVPSPLVLPADSSRGIFVVYIPTSMKRPHMVRSEGIFYRRGEGGTAEQMSFYEVREQMLYTEDRLQRVTLFRLQIAQYRRLAKLLTEAASQIFTKPERFDTSGYMPLLADICGLTPLSKGKLADLIDVPTKAAVINRLLDEGRGTPTNTLPQYWNYPAYLAEQFSEDCARFEHELEGLFGSLGL